MIREEMEKEFWKFVDLVDWMGKDNLSLEDLVLQVIAKKFTYSEFLAFEEIARRYYSELNTRLYDIWLSKESLGPSDDGYTDLRSSIIGKGEKFTKFMLSDDEEAVKKEFLRMTDERDYRENFMYIFHFDDEDLYKKNSRVEKLNQLLD